MKHLFPACSQHLVRIFLGRDESYQCIALFSLPFPRPHYCGVFLFPYPIRPVSVPVIMLLWRIYGGALDITSYPQPSLSQRTPASSTYQATEATEVATQGYSLGTWGDPISLIVSQVMEEGIPWGSCIVGGIPRSLHVVDTGEVGIWLPQGNQHG